MDIKTYGEYKSIGYGAHTLKVTTSGLTVWYSYKTIVAFYTAKHGKVVCENIWGATTGKHLNWIDGGDKKTRVPHDRFQVLLAEAIKENQG